MRIGRREFMKVSGATALCACAAAVGIGGCSKSGGMPQVPLAPAGSYWSEEDQVVVSLSDLEGMIAGGRAVRLALGGAEDPGGDIILVKLGEADYRAFENRCTHNGKELVYEQQMGRLECQSGKSHFDLRGKVLKGPAEGPLLEFATRQNGRELIICL